MEQKTVLSKAAPHGDPQTPGDAQASGDPQAPECVCKAREPLSELPGDAQASERVGKAPRRAQRGAFPAVLAGLAYLGVYLFVQVAVSLAAALAFVLRMIRTGGISNLSELFETISLQTQQASMLLTLFVNALTLLAFYLIFRIRKKSVATELRLVRVPFARLAPLIPLGILLNVLISSVLTLLPPGWIAAYEDASANVLGTGLNAFTALMIAVLAPLTEEVLFRGLVYTRFLRGLPRWLAVALSALLFGLLHVQPVWIAYATLFGVLLCLLMDRYGSLWASVVLHMAFNAGSFFVLLLSDVSAVTLIPVSAAAVTGLLMGVFRMTAGGAQPSKFLE